MKKYVNLFVFVFMIGACLSQGRAQTKSAVSYKNPVVDIAMPDPTVIKAADGYFYVYASSWLHFSGVRNISSNPTSFSALSF